MLKRLQSARRGSNFRELDWQIHLTAVDPTSDVDKLKVGKPGLLDYYENSP